MNQKFFIPTLVVIFLIVIIIIAWPRWIGPVFDKTPEQEFEQALEESKLSAEELKYLNEQERLRLIEGENGWIYYKAGGKRYIFQNEETFKSWFSNERPPLKKTIEQLANIPLGGSITLKPGNIIKTINVAGYFYVDFSNTLRVFKSEDQIKKIFGSGWEERVIDVPNYYYTEYKLGGEFDYDKKPYIPESLTISENFNLE